MKVGGPVSDSEGIVSLPGVDICLLQMPYSTLHNPSIGLGLLKACAAARGLSAKVLYPNLDWAEEIGFEVFTPIQRSRVDHQLGEWTFAGAAFPEHVSDKKDFFALAGPSIRSTNLRLLSEVHGGIDLEGLMDIVRLRAPAFIDRMAHKSALL